MNRLRRISFSGGYLVIALVVGVFCLFSMATTWLLRLAFIHDSDPQEYEAFIIDFLGIQGLYTAGVGPTFEITYWNGQKVMFWVPGEVWAASVAAGNEHGCEPWLVIATAFSESTQYNNSVKSSAGALGVWQFILSTWNILWGNNPPPRTHIPSAADAACRYLKKTGAASAFRKGEESFVQAFAVSPPVWNRHEGQARFVYRLTKKLIAHDKGTFQPPYLAALTTTKWWSPIAIFFLDLFGLMPEFKYAEGIVGVPGSPGVPGVIGASGSSVPFIIPSGMVIGQAIPGWICSGSWQISQNLHGANYGHKAYDIVCGGNSNAPLFSPLEGKVTAKYLDGYGNTVLVIENEQSEVTLLHGYYSVEVGDQIETGGHIGYQANFGNTWSQGEYCGTGSGCGQHTHINVYDKGEGSNVNPLNLIKQTYKKESSKKRPIHRR